MKLIKINFKKIYRIIILNRERFQFVLKFLSKVLPARFLIKILKVKFENANIFMFNDIPLKYFYHSYALHRLSERAIEIPIIKYYMKKTGKRDFLEIGNVTNHYYSYFQDIINSKIVVDKYEKGWGVINKDINDYLPQNKLDFIFSISTFEHMDSDSGVNPISIKKKKKLLTYAADNIVHVCNNMLKNGGILLITAPMGQHIEWDQTVFSEEFLNKDFLKVKFVKVYFFKKINEIEWIQTTKNEIINSRENYPFPGVNGLSIVEIIK